MNWEDWYRDEMEQPMDFHAEEQRREYRLAVFWSVVFGVLAALLVFCWLKVRADRASETERLNEACPSGTAARVAAQVNAQPLPRICNRVADVVFGKVN